MAELLVASQECERNGNCTKLASVRARSHRCICLSVEHMVEEIRGPI